MKIVLDTNFLIDCIRFKIDLGSELSGNDLFVLDSTIFEIAKITKRSSNEASLAKLALELTKGKNIRILKSNEKETDESLISCSKQGYAIATHDRILKKRLKKAGARIIYIRQKKYLVTD